MLKTVKKWSVPVAVLVFNLVSALFWVALRVNYSGISKFLGADTDKSFLIMNLPVMVCVLAWLGAALALWGLVRWERQKWPSVAALVIGLITAVGAVVVVIFGARDYIRFIRVHFFRSLAVTACIAVVTLLLFFPVKGKKVWKAAFAALVTLAAVVIGYGLWPCTLTYGAVVYAVEDDYQIVFSTSDSAIAWVEIGGETYYDLYAGSMRSVDKVHKVTVPQSVLDAAGSYTVCAQQMIYRGPFGGYKGEVLSEKYDFRPVNASDGLNYCALSDVHEALDPAIRAATSRQDTDFVVLIGDLISMVETEKDVQFANELAYGITKGEIPVVYARGNHEIKGEYAEYLYKYVGSRNQEFYYWFTLGSDVFGVVLDLGEDHADDWWEYYGTARFDIYRQAQTEMLKEILDQGNYENYRYRLALCHIPVVYVDRHGYYESFRNEWTELLNAMDVDMCLSGHKHVLWPFLPDAVESGGTLEFTPGYAGKTGKTDGGYLTDFNFPGFLVGRRSLLQSGGTADNYDEYTCLHTRVDFAQGRQISNYVNSNREILTGYYPFLGDLEYETFSDIATEIKRPEK